MDILLDRGACGKVRSQRGIIRLFQQRDDGLAALLPLEKPFGGTFGVRDTLQRSHPSQTLQNWRDRRIIP
jgi:hypothetical protein